MILSSIEKLAGDIGFDIGMSNDVVQADLLNGFGRAMGTTPGHNCSLQCCYIVDKLEAPAKKVIKELYDFIKLQEDEK
jgi:hypothetical protein